MKRNVRYRFLLLLSTLLVASLATACNYHNLVLMEHDYRSAVMALQTAEASEFAAGNVDATTHAQIQGLVLRLAQGGQQVATLLQANASKQTIAAQVGLINAAVQTLLTQGVLGIKNSTTQTNIRVMTQAISDIIQNFATALGSPIQTTTTVK